LIISLILIFFSKYFWNHNSHYHERTYYSSSSLMINVCINLFRSFINLSSLRSLFHPHGPTSLYHFFPLFFYTEWHSFTMSSPSSPYLTYSFIWLFFNSFFFIKATHLYNHKTTTKTFVWKNFDQGWALSRGVWMTSFVMPYLW